MSPAPAISITLTLNPPPGTSPPETLTPHSTLSFPATSDPTAPAKPETYYPSLRQALSDAREGVGEVLTRWRDAVGEGERGKEVGVGGGKGRRGGKREEEMEEDEEDEQ